MRLEWLKFDDSVPARIKKKSLGFVQKVLQGRDVDVWYATWWSGNWQIVWGFVCIPLMWIPLPGQPQVHPSTFFQDLADTLSCIGGNAPRY